MEHVGRLCECHEQTHHFSDNLPVKVNIVAYNVSRLMIMSREAKKKQAVRSERVNYLHVAPL